MDQALASPRLRASSAVRSGTIIGLLGFLTVLPFYIWIHNLQAKDKSAAALAMSSMHMNNMHQFWSFPILQATGIAGLIWAYFGVTLGLFESGKTVSWVPLSRPQIDRLHRQISLLVIALMTAHVVATALDAMGDSWKTVLIPWQWANQGWPQAVTGYTTGIVAFYLALLLGPTYYIRNTIGHTRWRFLHRFVVVVYILSFWHTMILGLDISHYGWVRPFMWITQIPLLLLFGRRLLQPAASTRSLSPSKAALRRVTTRSLAVASWVGIVAVAVIVFTGNSDFINNV
jgi:methionine sulfoxide reductase heme-binding subunit